MNSRTGITTNNGQHWPKRSGDERADYGPFECDDQTSPGFLYILGSEDGQRVKMGFTTDESKLSRLATHAEGDAFKQGGDYTILALVRGGGQNESIVQNYFDERRVWNAKKKKKHKEVFHASPDLIDYVVWLRDLYFVSISVDEFYSEKGRKLMASSLWVPGPGRASARRNAPDLFADLNPWAVLPERRFVGDDWYTPEPIVTCCRAALGGIIDLDPASDLLANGEYIQARQIFTEEQNGLIRPWAGRIFLNPPFSKWSLFAAKVLEEVEAGHVEAIVMVAAIRTLTANYLAPLLQSTDAICIVTGRYAFWGINSDSSAPIDGHCLLYIGREVERFRRATDLIGISWRSDDVVTHPLLDRAADTISSSCESSGG